MLERLKLIVEGSDTRSGRAFDLGIQSLIIVSIMSYSIETMPEISQPMLRALHVCEVLCVVLFTVEYLLRLLLADRKLRFVFSFFGMIDLLAILPFYLALGADLRSLRAVRLVRLFRVLKLIRYSRAMRRMHIALLIAKEEIVLFFFTTAILLFFAAAGVYHFEHDAQPDRFRSIFDGVWWAVATLTTVGYGDAYPITAGGRAFTIGVLFIGLGVVSVPAGLVASALSKARELEDLPDQEIAAALHEGAAGQGS